MNPITTQGLLRLSCAGALVRMINGENNTHWAPDLFVFGEPRVTDGRKTEIDVSFRDSYGKNDVVPPPHSFVYEYFRLDVAEHFQGVLSGYRPALPTSTQVLLDEITQRTGQAFERDDFILEPIGRHNVAPYRLRAKRESLRWVGAVEFTLADMVDLPNYLGGALPSTLGALSETPLMRAPRSVLRLTNATSQRRGLSGVAVGDFVQDHAGLIALIQLSVPHPGDRLDMGTNPWVFNGAPRPFNLHNAKVTAIRTANGPHPINTTLNRVLEITLDLAYCTALDDPILEVRYRDDDYADSTFNNTPRLTQIAVMSQSDATAYNEWFNQRTIGEVITALPAASINIRGPVPWVANATPSKTNLSGAVVQYNGQRRGQDPQNQNPDLNRVCMVTLGDRNTAYRGNMAIHYRAPIVLAPTIPNAQYQTPYSAPLNPTHGQAPYQFTVVGGALAPGHSINPTTHAIEGSATTHSTTYRPVIRVRDARGVSVDYNYSYYVTVAPLQIQRTILDARPTHLDMQYQAVGGVGPYAYYLDPQQRPPNCTFDPATGHLVGQPPAGSYTWTIGATDTRGVVTSLNDSKQVE